MVGESITFINDRTEQKIVKETKVLKNTTNPT
jgi:hypothetical protein